MNTTTGLTTWTWQQKCLRTVESLGKNGFTAKYCATVDEARQHILDEAVDAATVAFGGSMTIAGMGVEQLLQEQGKEILNHAAPGLSRDEKMAVMRRGLTADLYLSGTNALTMRGELINIDATGNRVAAMFFGPHKVIVVAGRNKLVDSTAEEAVTRVKQWATPPNARRLNFNTPCATTGFCSNCNSPDRLCRITTIIDRKPRFTDLQVLVVNADLGL